MNEKLPNIMLGFSILILSIVMFAIVYSNVGDGYSRTAKRLGMSPDTLKQICSSDDFYKKNKALYNIRDEKDRKRICSLDNEQINEYIRLRDSLYTK